jgi:hypothetical protein
LKREKSKIEWDKNNSKRLAYLKNRSEAFSFVSPKTKAKQERFNSQDDYVADLKKLKAAIDEKLSTKNKPTRN